MTRLEQARAEIARRRELAEGSLTVLGSGWEEIADPWPTRALTDPSRLASRLLTSARRAQLILANDPSHVVAVLAAADATLDRHRPNYEGTTCPQCRLLWPCPDAAAVLDLYAPEATDA